MQAIPDKLRAGIKPMGPNLKRKIVIHRKITWLLLFSVFSLLVAYWFVYTSKKSIETTNVHINNTQDLIVTVQACITSVAETGTITPLLLDSLNRLSHANNDFSAALPVLHQLIAAGKPAAEIKGQLYRMLQEEKALLKERKFENDKVVKRVTNGMYIGRTGAFLLVAIILLMVNKDITRHKETQRKLIEAIEEARKAKKMQEQFLANMSHEIRTPMNGIKGMTDLLLETPL